MKENKTKYMILGLLNHEPMSGYDIKERADNALSMFWSSGFGQIYPTLQTLEDEGNVELLKTETREGPIRRVYQITPKGVKVLKNWLSTVTVKEDIRYEILLKFFFSSIVDLRVTIKNIEDFKQRKQLEKAKLDMFSSELSQIIDLSEDHLFFYLTARFGQKVHAAYLEWACEAIAMLEKEGETK